MLEKIWFATLEENMCICHKGSKYIKNQSVGILEGNRQSLNKENVIQGTRWLHQIKTQFSKNAKIISDTDFQLDPNLSVNRIKYNQYFSTQYTAKLLNLNQHYKNKFTFESSRHTLHPQIKKEQH